MLLGRLGVEIELNVVLEGVDAQINQLGKLARDMSCSIHEIRNVNGDFMLAPLLHTKALLLDALVRLGIDE